MEILIIVVATLINGFFAMSEIGLVSARKARLRELADRGDLASERALALMENPSRLLSTVQIGITFASVVGAIYGGAALGQKLGPVVAELNLPWISAHARSVSEGLVSAAIGAFTIIFAELVPKRLALIFPDTVARHVAAPMTLATKLALPAVKIFSHAADGFLRLMGLKKSVVNAISDDEVRMLIDQGVESGSFHSGERDMVDGILSLDKLTAGGLMTPRSRVVWLNLQEADETNWRKVAGSDHTHFPVHDGGPDHVIGVVSVKSMWANLALSGKAEIRHLLTPALTTPMNTTATKLLETFKRERRHMALVIDEFGSVRGLVTLNDVLEYIVGDIPENIRPSPPEESHRIADGVWLVDGLMEIGDLKDLLDLHELPGEDRATFHTLAGFILHRLGRIPKPGDKFLSSEHIFEVVSLEGQRIDKVRISEAPDSDEGE